MLDLKLLDLKKNYYDIILVSFTVFKVMIPTLVLVKIAQESGLVIILDKIFMPITELIGLPQELSIVLTTTMLTNPYAGLIVLASINVEEGLSVAQSSILASFMLFTHALPIETAISRQAGSKALFNVALRILTSILYCFLLNNLLTYFALFQDQANFRLPEFEQTTNIVIWATDQLKGLAFIQIVIVSLLVTLEILKKLGIEHAIISITAPFLKILGIGKAASTIVVVGLTLGLGFGGGLMIKDVRAGNVNEMDAIGALIFINLFHSVIEDTFVILLLGPSLFLILFCRLLFVLIISYLVIIFLRKIPWSVTKIIAINTKVFKKI